MVLRNPLHTKGGEISPAILTGQIQRVPPPAELLAQLESASSNLDRAIAYAEQGIWHEAFQARVHLRLDSADDSSQMLWSDFLSDGQVGLTSIIDAPLGGGLQFAD